MTKPTWVFTAGTYRSASTTLYQLVRDIVEETDNGFGIGYHTENKLLEQDTESDKRFIVCKVFEYLPAGFRGETSHGEILHRHDRIKSVVTIRDPRDIMVSMKQRDVNRGVQFSFKATATEMFPLWLGWLTRWVDLGPKKTLVVRYEDFAGPREAFVDEFRAFVVDAFGEPVGKMAATLSQTLCLLREVLRIADHLDIKLDPQKAVEIAGRYTSDAITRRKKERDKSKPEDPWLPGVPAIVFGTSGQWRELLSEKEREMVVEANREFMERFGYNK